MYKKILTLLTSLLLIGVSVQGYYLVKHIQSTKINLPKQDMYNQQMSALQSHLNHCQQRVDYLNNELYNQKQKIQDAPLATEIVEKTRKATVTINTKTLVSAYFYTGRCSGTGVIIDKTKGLILTNAHVVRPASISNYEAMSYNGNILKATLVYYDPWLDIAVLQIVDPKQLIHENEAKLSTKAPILNQPIFISGNNEGNSHSVHTGRISHLKNIIQSSSSNGLESLPGGCLTYSLNRSGGASGSGVFNYQGEMIALHYSGRKSVGHGVSLGYLKYILSFIKKGKTPPRQHIGIITKLCSLSDIIQYAGIDEKELSKVKSELSKETQHLIIVKYTLKNAPAQDIIQSGDIVYKVNDQLIENDLVKLDLIMSNSSSDTIKLTLFRNGKKIEKQVKLYDTHQYTIKKMVCFGGALFFQANEHWANHLNIPAGTLTFHKISKGSSFNTSKYFRYRTFLGKLISLDGIPVTTLEELVHGIPSLIDKKHFTIHVQDIYKYQRAGLINYSDLDSTPQIYTYKEKAKKWEKKKMTT